MRDQEFRGAPRPAHALHHLLTALAWAKWLQKHRSDHHIEGLLGVSSGQGIGHVHSDGGLARSGAAGLRAPGGPYSTVDRIGIDRKTIAEGASGRIAGDPTHEIFRKIGDTRAEIEDRKRFESVAFANSKV